MMENRAPQSENRHSPRRPMAIDASIIYKDLPIPNCKISNISFDGAFINTPAAAPPKNGVIRLILNDSTKQQLFTLNGQVVYAKNKGAGLRFQSLDSDTYSTLFELLIAWSTQPGIPKVVKIKEEIHSNTEQAGGFVFW